MNKNKNRKMIDSEQKSKRNYTDTKLIYKSNFSKGGKRVREKEEMVGKTQMKIDRGRKIEKMRAEDKITRKKN